MPALMPRRPDASTWPLAWSLAAVWLLLMLAVPESWWWLLIPDRPAAGADAAPRLTVLELVDIEIRRPPPPVVRVPDDAPPPRAPAPPADAAWWTDAWNVRIAADLAAPAAGDTVLTRPVLDLLAAGPTIDAILARPDSLIEARLWQLVQEHQLARNDARGIYTAIAKARAFADMKSREAAMFDEFARETVPVTR